MNGSPVLQHCTLCPRNCRADRLSGARGRCHESADIRIARASLHFWEEPCISGTAGSGTVFFTGCPLGCVYCQNGNIAGGRGGTPVSEETLAAVFLRLQELGASNINLVTPTHFVPEIAESLKTAKENGLTLPVVYNTGSYETVETLRRMEGLVDIWLPDLKYVSPEPAERYSHAPDYFPVASAAIAEMVRQAGSPVFDTASGLMKRGVLVRHLILPGQTADSKQVIRYLYGTYGDGIWMSIMNQYTPMKSIRRFPELNRKVSDEEYRSVVDYAADLGVTQAFVQEGEAAEESFIPDFEHFSVAEFLKHH